MMGILFTALLCACVYVLGVNDGALYMVGQADSGAVNRVEMVYELLSGEEAVQSLRANAALNSGVRDGLKSLLKIFE